MKILKQADKLGTNIVLFTAGLLDFFSWVGSHSCAEELIYICVWMKKVILEYETFFFNSEETSKQFSVVLVHSWNI